MYTKVSRSERDDNVCKAVTCNDCGVYQLCAPFGVDEDVDAVLEGIIKRRATFRRGEVIFAMGQPFESVYAIKSGSVKTFVSTDDGRIQVTGFHVAGELLGLSAISSGIHTSEARALEATSVCEVAIDRLDELARRTPSLQRALIRIMSDEIEHHQELMLLLGKKTAEERVATYLLSLSRRFARRNFSPTQFHLSMSRGDIGNYLGIAEETVCRIFTRFEDEGLVTIRHRHVQLDKVEGLNRIAHDHHAYLRRLAESGSSEAHRAAVP